jgi:hypothetical protein
MRNMLSNMRCIISHEYMSSIGVSIVGVAAAVSAYTHGISFEHCYNYNL